MPGGKEALIRRAYRAFAARDMKLLTELASPEIEIETMTGLLAGREQPYRGHEGIGQYLADTAEVWRRLDLFPKEFVDVDEERVLVFGRVRAWHKRGFVDSANAWLWTVREGKVASVQLFASPTDARTFVAREGEGGEPSGDEAPDP